MVRAKFRVLEVRHILRGNLTVLSLKPVIAKSQHWPQGAEENRRFWEASPSGDMTLRFQRGTPLPLDLGDYVYVDLQEVGDEETRSWKLYEVSEGESQLGIKLGLPWLQKEALGSGDLQLSIENREAWKPFQGKAGSKWAVVLVKAGDETHENCPYTSG